MPLELKWLGMMVGCSENMMVGDGERLRSERELGERLDEEDMVRGSLHWKLLCPEEWHRSHLTGSRQSFTR